MGNGVDCACYSKHLSKRDFDDFRPVFAAFEVRNMIEYGTFRELSELSIKRGGDVSKLTNAMLALVVPEEPFLPMFVPEDTKKRVLLIDEVDVFFSADFYGESYTPSAKYKIPEIEFLQKYIWDHRLGHFDGAPNLEEDECEKRRRKFFKEITSLTEYQKLGTCNGTDFKAIVDQHLNAMLIDLVVVLKEEMDPKPFLNAETGQLGYQFQDSYDYAASVRYQTLFAYFKEVERLPTNMNLKTQLASKLGLDINCGSFSYAEIPKPAGKKDEKSVSGKEYTAILGVTGTLDCLGAFEENVVQVEYGIRCKTFTPSIYGDNRLEWDPTKHLIIEKTREDWSRAIKQEIVDCKTVEDGCLPRPIIIFFETEKAMLDWKASEHYEAYKANTYEVTAAMRSDMVKHAVKRAVKAESITLLSAVHGRGLDFSCRHAGITKAGGVHVVQTFLSENISEEVQIKGRTARMTDKGSYKLVLSADDVFNKFGIDWDTIEEQKAGGFERSSKGKGTASGGAAGKGTASGGAAGEGTASGGATEVESAAAQIEQILLNFRVAHIPSSQKQRARHPQLASPPPLPGRAHLRCGCLYE
jgi:hypothetical protein